MPKTLQDVLKTLKRRAQKQGPEAVALYSALDKHFASVARELEALRQTQGMTQRELAKRSHVDQAEISRILSGRTQPRVHTAARIARAMGAELRVVQPRRRRPRRKSP